MKKMKRIVLKNLLIIIFLFSNKIFSQAISNQSVITEEYVPKVIIEGKWGTNAGEFGVQECETDPFCYKPESIAVNSKGEIYVLDLVNNRIQKFNNDGEYILSIPVDSFIGDIKKYIPRETLLKIYEEIGKEYLNDDEYKEQLKNRGVAETNDILGRPKIIPNKVKGINIVVDDSDVLYYYCKKIKEKKGEVWVFKNDKLVRKFETNVIERFEPAPDYEVEKQKIDKDREKIIIKFKDGRKMNFEYKQIDNENRKIQFTDKNGKVKEFQFKPNRKLKENEKYFVSKEPEVKNNRIFISTGIFKRPFNYSDLFTYVYDLEGNLLSIAKGIIFKENPIDSDRYYLETTNEGIKVIKFKREPIK